MNSAGEWTNPGDWISYLFASHIPLRRRRRNRRNGIDHSDESTEPSEKKDDDDDQHRKDDDYIEFCFKQDGEFEVVSDDIPVIPPSPPTTDHSAKEEAEEGSDGKQSDVKRSDGRDSSSSDGSFTFPVLKWGEMVGSPVQMPKAEELQLEKQRASRPLFQQCWRF